MLKSKDLAENPLGEADSVLLHQCIKGMCCATHQLLGLGLIVPHMTNCLWAECREQDSLRKALGLLIIYFQILLPVYSRK